MTTATVGRTTKRCASCTKVKPLGDFYTDNRYCKPCTVVRRRAYRQTTPFAMAELKRRYGWTVEQYEAVLARQQRACETCFEPHEDRNRGRLLPLINAPQVRALFCRRCCVGIAMLGTDVETISNAVKALRRKAKVAA